MMRRKRVVLVFSGSDPTGGAGLQADILTLAQLDCHPLSVVTSVTSQDTTRVYGVKPLDSAIIREQTRAVLGDVEVDAFKIGMIPNEKVLDEVVSTLLDFPEKEVVFDPVLAAGGGYEFTSSNLVNQIRDKLLPLVTILTPNIKELNALNCVDESGPIVLGDDQLAAELISLGVKSVLVTGTHADSNDVENRLYDFSGFLGSWTWPRLDNEYHGSGCTLASAIAGYLVSGEDLKDAVFKGQQFTWNSLKDGYVIGSGQLIPDRGGGIK